MNTYAIIPEKNFSLTLIALQIVSLLVAGVFLFTSRFYSFALIPAILLLGVAVYLAGYSRNKLFSILLVGMFTALILSLRFDYLTWGDPWFEYGMVQRILAFQSLDPSVYPAQLPVIHVIVATLSLFSGINPLDLQKIIIPSLSVIGLYAVYRFTNDLSSSAKTAFFAGILLICGTPYLHWTTQGLRETLGIALFALALYISFTAIQSHKKAYLLISLLLIGGLVLTHDLSSIMFLLVWIAVSLTFLYLMCDLNRIRTTSLYSLIIASSTVIFISIWGMGHSVWGYGSFRGLMTTVFHSEYGILLFILILIFLYLFLMKSPDKILVLRSIVNKILIRKNIIYTVFIIVTVISSGVVLNFILGKSSFVLSYPLPMFFNGICMILLSLIGLYYFLEIGRFHILAWIATLSLILVLSMSNVVPFVDPLRFMEFLYIPLTIVAAFGVTRIAESISSPRFFSIFFALIVVVFIITSFPSVVFLGQPFEQNHVLYDNRNWVIEHEVTEISAISWLHTNRAKGIVGTDTYVGYAARAILVADPLSVDTLNSFIRIQGYPYDSDINSDNRYLIIVSRMNKYMEFGAQWLKEKKSLEETDLRKINDECNKLYDNGKSVIYSFSTSCCWVPPS